MTASGWVFAAPMQIVVAGLRLGYLLFLLTPCEGWNAAERQVLPNPLLQYEQGADRASAVL
jgi:hypothetical protein